MAVSTGDTQRDKPSAGPGVGIDFGTSKSAVGIAWSMDGQGIERLLVRSDAKAKASTSCFFYPSYFRLWKRSDNKVLLYRLQDQPGPLRPPQGSDEFVTMDFKLRVGQGWSKGEQKTLEEVLDGYENPLPDPEEVAGVMLARLREAIQRYSEDEIQTGNCVLSVPPSWTYTQRRATRYAARMAGFEDVELIEEPVASLIGLKTSSEDLLSEGLYLVVDYGAGTCDVALIKKQAGRRYRIIDSDSDDELGGRDIDRRFLEWSLSRSPAYELHLDRPAIARKEVELDSYEYYYALWEVEKWKIKNNNDFLSGKSQSSTLFLERLEEIGSHKISRAEFRRVISDSVEHRLKDLLAAVLNNQRDKLPEIKKIVITGGASQIIGFPEMVTDSFGRICESLGVPVESVDSNLLFEAENPIWTVVRGSAVASLGLTIGRQLVTLPLDKNMRLEVKDEAGRPLKLVRGSQRVKGSQNRNLPLYREACLEVQHDTESVHIDILASEKIQDSLTLRPLYGHIEIPAGAWMLLKYRIRMDKTVHVDDCLVVPSSEVAVEHDGLHHTDIDGADAQQLMESRDKFVLRPDIQKKLRERNPRERWQLTVRRFFYRVDWQERLVNFVVAFVLSLVLLRLPAVALAVALLLAVALPEGVNLLSLLLKIVKEIRKNLNL